MANKKNFSDKTFHSLLQMTGKQVKVWNMFE
jgi:hypothetical protein